jgi:glycosyltransferase involved in cell wall biosynthesis
LCNPTFCEARITGPPYKGLMGKDDPTSITNPLFSVIIATYNDWEPLDHCLRSLDQQINAPTFEVIVVDDGSREVAPQSIDRWTQRYSLRVVSQPHAGVSAARNRGVELARGSMLVFVDADCRVDANCLAALGSTIINSAQDNCFQLHLTGDCSKLVGRAEELRLMTLQNHLLQPGGYIRYLNTAGFAIRGARAGLDRNVFDPVAIRAEDTLLLANLITVGKLPLFVPGAIVQHAPPLSVMAYLSKAVRSGYLEAKTYDVIASKGVRIRVTHRERLRMLKYMWKVSIQHSIGRQAWFLLVMRQALQRMSSFACGKLWVRAQSPKSTNPS